jgi:probable rRNA maturation factor
MTRPRTIAPNAAHGAMEITNRVAVQVAAGVAAVPRATVLRRWARAALAGIGRTGSMCVRVVDAAEMQDLNERFRHRPGTTNVLSFTADTGLPDVGEHLLGDVVICAPVVAAEAAAQHKSTADHFAHLVVHGVLHLCGYDHETAKQARVMEGHEVAILRTLGIADPYRSTSANAGAALSHE